METDFKKLVDLCIEAFSAFFDDALSLDYNKVTDTKLRALILQDPTYRTETRYLRAQRAMSEIKELDDLADLAAKMGNNWNSTDKWNPRDGEDKEDKKVSGADKDVLTMRFKAAQERRELLKSLSTEDGGELDAVNLFFIPIDKETFERIDTTEVVYGSGDNEDALNTLTGTKEAPVQGSGVAGKEDVNKNPVFIYDDEGNITGMYGER